MDANPAGPERMLLHLEMIQGVISRMARHSFLLKGWAATLVATTLWLSFSMPEAAIQSAAAAIFVIAIFWGLDGYYLRHERLFRCLYDKVRKQDDTDFAMDAQQFQEHVPSLLQTCLSLSQVNTLLMFNGAQVALVCVYALAMLA